MKPRHGTGIESHTHTYLHDRDAREVRLGARLGQLVRRLVDQRHVSRGHALHDALRAKPGAAADVDDLRGARARCVCVVCVL